MQMGNGVQRVSRSDGVACACDAFVVGSEDSGEGD